MPPASRTSAAATDSKAASSPAANTSIRLSGEAGPHFEVLEGETKPYRIDNAEKTNPLANTRISGDPALMGDQEKMGLATMAAFFRRYVGGEGGFEPYLTGELAAEGKPSIPESACPTSLAGQRIPCLDRVADSYTAPPSERMDVLRPDTEHPTTLSMHSVPRSRHSGFANPYLKGGGISPRPATTASGIDWCNPNPKQQEPGAAERNQSVRPLPSPARSSRRRRQSVARARGKATRKFRLRENWPRSTGPTGASWRSPGKNRRRCRCRSRPPTRTSAVTERCTRPPRSISSTRAIRREAKKVCGTRRRHRRTSPSR